MEIQIRFKNGAIEYAESTPAEVYGLLYSDDNISKISFWSDESKTDRVILRKYETIDGKTLIKVCDTKAEIDMLMIGSWFPTEPSERGLNYERKMVDW